MAVIGIDFGTEFSSVAARLQDGHIHSLPDDQGKIRISSCVSFLDDEIRIGNLAELKREANPANTIYDIKKLLGQPFKNAEDLKKKYHWTFALVKDGDGKAQVEVQHLNATHRFYPEEVVGMLLGHLVQIAEKRLRERVSKAVITVSSSFNHSQRKAIMDAARIAQLEVTSILNETTAAALCYSSSSNNSKMNVMVIHIGAGSYAVSVCNIKGLTVSVKATRAESIGGKDVNMDIFQYLQKILQSKSDRIVHSYNYSNLQKDIERVKKDFHLPNKRQSKIEIQLGLGNKKEHEIKRSRFDEICRPLKETLHEAVKDCASRVQIDKVILVGGSSRLPFVHDILKDLDLNIKMETAGVKTDETVLLGAGILAGLGMQEFQQSEFPRVNEVLTYSVKDKNNIELAGTNIPLPIDLSKGQSLEFYDGNKTKMVAFSKLPATLKINRDGIISVSNEERSEMKDGLSQEKIDQLAQRQSLINQGEVQREYSDQEMYELEKLIFDGKKLAKKILSCYDYNTIKECIKNNPVVRHVQLNVGDTKRKLVEVDRGIVVSDAKEIAENLLRVCKEKEEWIADNCSSTFDTLHSQKQELMKLFHSKAGELHALFHEDNITRSFRKLARDVLPMSVGIKTKGGIMSTVVTRYTEFPTNKYKFYTTVDDNQRSMKFSVYEGERPNVEFNHLLDHFMMNDIPPKPAGTPNVKVTFKIDEGGILNVTAFDVDTNRECSISIDKSKRSSNKDDIDYEIALAEEHRHDDEQWKKKTQERNDLEAFAKKMRKAKNWPAKEEAERVLRWLEKHPVASENEYHQQRKRLQQFNHLQ